MSNKTEILEALREAYNKELETIINYLSNSINLDGVRADFVKKDLAADIVSELGHATQLGNRIRQLGGTVPGSMELKMMQKTLQPPARTTDVVSVIEGVLEAEEDAITHYNKIIKLCEGVDYVTQDLAIQLLADEEAHRQSFQGFLKEYTQS